MNNGGGKGAATLHVTGSNVVNCVKMPNPKYADTLKLYTKCSGKRLGLLVTEDIIPQSFYPEKVTLMNDQVVSCDIIGKVPVLSVGSKEKAWCGKAATKC